VNVGPYKWDRTYKRCGDLVLTQNKKGGMGTGDMTEAESEKLCK
jgi:hypothetical protein